MKYIQKRQEPQIFSEWKATQKPVGNYHYKHFLNPERKAVHISLLSEQGYICCYCCKSVDQSNSHIEHLDPQSTLYISVIGRLYLPQTVQQVWETPPSRLPGFFIFNNLFN